MADQLNPDDIKNLIELAKAQQDANRLEASRQNIDRRKETILLELVSTNQQLGQEARQLIYETRELIDGVRRFLAAQELRDEATIELAEVISERMVTLERGIMLNLIDDLDNAPLQKAAQEVVSELSANIDKERLGSKRRQLLIEVGNLAKYEEERAELGGEVNVALENRITRTKERIVKLEDEIRQ